MQITNQLSTSLIILNINKIPSRTILVFFLENEQDSIDSDIHVNVTCIYVVALADPWGFFPRICVTTSKTRAVFRALRETVGNSLTFCLNDRFTVDGCNWKSGSSAFFIRVKSQNVSMLTETRSSNTPMVLNPSIFFETCRCRIRISDWNKQLTPTHTLRL